MSYKTRQEAEYAANRAFKNHGIKGAKVWIHENLGWHFSLRHRHFGIWLDEHSRKKRFWGMISRNGGGTGDLNYTATTHFYADTPKEVVGKMCRVAERYLKLERQMLNEVRKAIE